MSINLEWFFLDATQVILAGALGGLVRALSVKENRTLDIAKNVIIGSCCSFYLSPAVQPMMSGFLEKFVDAQPRTVAPLAGFVIGAGGLTVVTFFLDVVLAKFKRQSEKNDDKDR